MTTAQRGIGRRLAWQSLLLIVLATHAEAGTLNAGDILIPIVGGIERFSNAGVDLGRFATVETFRDIAIDAKQNVYVLSDQQIQKFSHSGALRLTTPIYGPPPARLAVGNDGTMYVTFGGREIFRFSASGEALGLFYMAARTNAFLTAMVFGSDGNLYAADEEGGRVLRVSPTGGDLGFLLFESHFGGMDLAADLRFGAIYVSNAEIGGVFKLSLDGSVLGGLGFHQCCKLAVDSEGNLYASHGLGFDGDPAGLEKFAPDGTSLGVIMPQVGQFGVVPERRGGPQNQDDDEQ
ncbi:MAG: hypothetical protein DME04_07480 [Candidatus Rokuibacteriota bacterium]|nr:MAG: hypothetical protein DME04_07480 [Candidatus Rokubacteria bacterium]